MQADNRTAEEKNVDEILNDYFDKHNNINKALEDLPDDPGPVLEFTFGGGPRRPTREQRTQPLRDMKGTLKKETKEKLKEAIQKAPDKNKEALKQKTLEKLSERKEKLEDKKKENDKSSYIEFSPKLVTQVLERRKKEEAEKKEALKNDKTEKVQFRENKEDIQEHGSKDEQIDKAIDDINEYEVVVDEPSGPSEPTKSEADYQEPEIDKADED